MVLTGSADKSIRLWSCINGGTCLKTIQAAHTDCVRSLAIFGGNNNSNGILFASTSNDALVKIWRVDGNSLEILPLQSLSGHSMFIYHLASSYSSSSSNNGRCLLVSCSEDRSFRIWSSSSSNPEGGAELLQHVAYPALSVWTACFIPKLGDIVVGGSDGIVRIFSASPDRVASAEAIGSYQEAVRAMEAEIAAKKNGGGNGGGNSSSSGASASFDRSQLKPSSALEMPGSKIGQILLTCREPSNPYDVDVKAHEWNGVEWALIGQVEVPAPPKKIRFDGDGKEYDFVFDVDIAPNVIVKLPYNLTDNVWKVAEDFCSKHDLDPSYTEQIVNFITQNSSSSGASSNSANNNNSGKSVDPWHDDSYHQAAATQPFQPITRLESYPEMIGNVQGWITKMKEFVSDDASLQGKLETFVQKGLLSNASSPEASIKGCSSTDLALVQDLLTGLKLDRLFPVVDLLRYLVSSKAPVVPVLYGDCVLAVSAVMALLNKSVAAGLKNNVMLLLKVLVNMAIWQQEKKAPEFAAMVLSSPETFAALLANPTLGKDARTMTAFLTLLLNLSIVSDATTQTAAYSQLLGQFVGWVSLGGVLEAPQIELLLRAAANAYHRSLVPRSLASNVLCISEKAAKSLPAYRQLEELCSKK